MDSDAASLEKVPRAESDELKRSIIRTTIKNENLLAKKMEKDKVRKKGNKKLNNSLKHKADRSTKVEGVLATKIQQSIERAKFVQTTRRAGWDQINKTIKIGGVSEIDLDEDKGSVREQKRAEAQAKAQAEKEAEEEYIRYFRAGLEPAGANKNGTRENNGEQEIEKNDDEQLTGVRQMPQNRFALLEVEDN